MTKKIIQGSWHPNDIRRVFVAGAKWWEFHKTKFTMWSGTDVQKAEKEATRRYPPDETQSLLTKLQRLLNDFEIACFDIKSEFRDEAISNARKEIINLFIESTMKGIGAE